MQRSSQERALRTSTVMGRIAETMPQAIAQVTTTAQLTQCLLRVEGREREGQMCVLKAAVRAATDVGAVGCRARGTFAQFPSAVSRAVRAEVLRRMVSVSTAANAGEPATSDRLVTKGIPALRDQRARLPKPAPRPLITEERKAS